MRFDDNFPKRLASARNAAGLTQANLASRAETVVRQIAAYEGGEARPRLKTLQKIASALGTTKEWLCEGIGEAPTSESFSRLRTIKQVPILADYEIESFVTTGQIDKGCKLHPVDLDVSDSAFAFVIHGDSMVSSGNIADQKGRNLSIPSGSIVVVEPEAIFPTGNIGLICQDGLIRVRKLTIEADMNVYIHALNNIEYPTEVAFYGAVDFIYPVVKLEVYLDNFRYKGDDLIELNQTTTPQQQELQAININHKLINKYDINDINNRLERMEAMLEQIINKQ